jgi:hypothetical protein
MPDGRVPDPVIVRPSRPVVRVNVAAGGTMDDATTPMTDQRAGLLPPRLERLPIPRWPDRSLPWQQLAGPFRLPGSAALAPYLTLVWLAAA